MSRVKTFFQWWSAQPHFAKVAPHIVPGMDRLTSRLTKGRRTMSQLMMPMVVLYAVGAKSGQERVTPLSAFPYEGGWLVIGSNFGRTDHPAWTGNLIKTPEVWCQPGTGRIPITALLLDGDDRQRAWDHVLARWSTYSAYEARLDREIRVFHLVPREVPPAV